MNSFKTRTFADWAGKFTAGRLLIALILVGLLAGCAVIDLGTAIKLGKVAVDVVKSFEDFTPEQEYYIGRTVGALIVDKYPPADDKTANQYLNILGQMLAQASDMPETYAGYRFLLLASDEINAFAAPGGLIFVSRGLLRCCPNEAAAAAVLAHEISHVQFKHGLQAIRKARITAALTNAALEGAKALGGDLAELTQTFGDSVADITTTLITKGYSRESEKEADSNAVTILKRVGYDPNGMVDMLKVMQTKLHPGGLDFAKTHPSPETRIAYIQEKIGAYAEVKPNKARQQRFSAALGKL